MRVLEVLKAKDNTGKISIELDDGSVIESVLLIDQTDRVTACLSCQVGCAQGCLFCKTGSMGLKRNLSVDEITEQFYLLQKSFRREITNIVYMGMGEPLHNIKNVMQSVRHFTNPKGLNIFLRRITISTSGYIKGLSELGKEPPFPGLAFSLITADQSIRDEVMPESPKLDIIKNSLIEYQKISNKRLIIEVIIFEGINNSPSEAKEIMNYLDGLDVIINLIPFNDIGSPKFRAPEMHKVKLFSTYLRELNLKVTIRHGKGQEIAGACGQLGKI